MFAHTKNFLNIRKKKRRTTAPHDLPGYFALLSHRMLLRENIERFLLSRCCVPAVPFAYFFKRSNGNFSQRLQTSHD